MQITLTTKNATIDFTPKSFALQCQKSADKTINFIQHLEKEVKDLPIKKKKKLKKAIVAFLSTLSATNHAMASNNLPIQEVFSNDLVTFVVGLVGGSIAIGVLLAMLTASWSGIIQLFNMEDYAVKWRQNITKGTGVIIFFPLVIILIVYLGHLLFGNTAFFLDPWNFIVNLFKK